MLRMTTIHSRINVGIGGQPFFAQAMNAFDVCTASQDKRAAEEDVRLPHQQVASHIREAS